jgi:hypothetical protein
LTASRRRIERPQRDDLLITEMLPEALDVPDGGEPSHLPSEDPAASSWGKRFAHSLSDEEERQRLAAASAKQQPSSRTKNLVGFLAGAIVTAALAYSILHFLGYV